jgi:hypothetical protein
MEQPEIPPEPPAAAPPEEAAAPQTAPVSDTPPKVELPDHKKAIPIPEQFRLPFMGKMSSPTSVPSAAQRQLNLERLKQKRRRRGFLTGLLVGQLLIIALDLGGEFLLRTHPQVKLQTSLPVSAIVFLGMAAGAAVMILAVALIYSGMALRGLFGKKSAVVAAGRGIWRVILTLLTLSVTMGVILGTAWFMIPREKWNDTLVFARDRGVETFEASKARVKGWLGPGPKP